jgi:CRP/FNR family cyclic AMP-dependent transcriptional regulator
MPDVMTGRFSGPDGRRLLCDAIQGQHLARGAAELAERLAAIASVESFAKGAYLTRQGGTDNDLYLLLSGRVMVVINGREMAQRHAGTHVGEMNLIDTSVNRSASCVALDDVEAARISEPAFSDLASRYPVLWRNIALVLGDRLRQRTAFVRSRNETPILFIGSSRESLPIATEIRAGLSSTSLAVRFWPDGVFMPSNFPLEDLENELDQADFAVLVFGPDDYVLSRRIFSRAPRDNVVLETGLFIGALRRQRTLIVKSRRLPIKMPSDLLGLTPIEFDHGPVSTLASRLRPACEAIAACVQRHGAQ